MNTVANTVSSTMQQGWSQAYDLYRNAGTELMMPSETLVRLFKGDYVQPLDQHNYQDKHCIDIGFGNGNNTRFLASLGMEVSAVEIHEAICNTAQSRFDEDGLPITCRVGTNQNIPHENDTSDYLVSWNVIHYEAEEANIRAAIAEYARVLKPGGRCYISTTGPRHKILDNVEVVGSHQYRIGRDGDFRQGQVHFNFDSERYIHHYFSEHFDNIQVGRIQDNLFKESLDWWLITATAR